MTFPAELERIASTVEQRLGKLLRADQATPPGAAELGDAMRYAALGGGKRLRPFLMIQSARLFGVEEDAALDHSAEHQNFTPDDTVTIQAL